MIKLSRRGTICVLAFGLIVAVLQSSPSANHSWGGYHWARTANPFTVRLGDNVSTAWDQYLNQASTDWSQSGVLDTTIVAGQASPRSCRPTAGQDQICNANYGNTGWLGVAQVWISGSHITQGTVKLNDTYFNTSKYNDPGWRQMVVCQEVGHTFGLDHQDENFNNTNLGTCMDYTSKPDGPLSNLQPNSHDYDELAIIYNHVDSATTILSSPGASGSNLDSPSSWGRLMKTTHGGRTQVFERDFRNGERVITFVIWA